MTTSGYRPEAGRHSWERVRCGIRLSWLFDPRSGNPGMLEVDDLQREMLTVMQKAKIREELIYAYLRTGLIVTEENYKSLAPEDRR